MTYLEVHEYAYCSFAIIEGTPHARVTQPIHYVQQYSYTLVVLVVKVVLLVLFVVLFNSSATASSSTLSV